MDKTKPERKSKVPVYVAVVGMMLGIVAALGYVILSLLEEVPMSWSIFFGWLALLAILDILLIYLFTQRGWEFSFRARAVMRLWGGITLWFWLFAPFFFYLGTNVNSLQLKWTALTFLWEVPVLGGLFMLVCLKLFRPIQEFEAKGEVRDPNKLYKFILRYPLIVGIAVVIFAVLGYFVASWQLRLFAFWPFIEQIKNIWSGTAIALFIGFFFYLIFDIFLAGLRTRLEKNYQIKDMTPRKMYIRIPIFIITITLAGSMLVGFFVFQSFQSLIKHSVTDSLTEEAEHIRLALAGYPPSVDTEAVLAGFKKGERGKIIVLNPKENVPAEGLSPETVKFVNENQAGVVEDLKNDYKVISFFVEPSIGKKIVSVAWTEEFYAPLQSTVSFFVIGDSLTILLVLGIVFFFVTLLIGAINSFSSAVERAEADLAPYTFHLSTADELEKLSHVFSRYITGLEEERSRLRASVQSLPLGFILVDAKQNIIALNSATKQLFGLSADAATFQDIARKLESVSLFEYYSRCLAEKRTIELKEVSMNGRFFRVFFTPVVLSRGTNEVIGMVILIEDITEQKLLDRAKDEFLSIASHELRTPLTVIRGNMAMIKQFFSASLREKKLKEMVDDSYNASVRLIKIVNDFLDVAGLEQKIIEFKKERFDLVELVKETISFQETEPLLGAKKLSLKLNLPPGTIPPVVADRDKAKQVLVNLISNAIEHTKKGDITLNVQAEDRFLKVLVSDTGSGIAPESRALLFRKFQQAGKSIFTRDVIRGTGLGLYISKMLIDGMGGKIGLLRSEVDKGSTFYFTLPAAL